MGLKRAFQRQHKRAGSDAMKAIIDKLTPAEHARVMGWLANKPPGVRVTGDEVRRIAAGGT